ncbi:MAG: hypothetical protein HWN68_18210, partial [Desulfobacterales bacterium]|nr:hypothetical protein [Desulfobacterales bacterium]
MLGRIFGSLMVFLLVVGLLLVTVGGSAASVLEPELVGSFSKTYRTTTTSTDFHLAIGLAAAVHVPEHEVWPGGPVVPARWDIDWSITRVPTHHLFQGMTPGSFLFEDIQFDGSSEEQTYTVSSVSDDPDFDDFAAFLTNGTDDQIWEAWIWPMDPVNAGGVRCAGGLSGFFRESDVFSGTDVGTDKPGWTIQSVSLTFDNIYTVHSGNFDWLAMDFTVDIYAVPEGWGDDNNPAQPNPNNPGLDQMFLMALPFILMVAALALDSTVFAFFGGVAATFVGLSLVGTTLWAAMIFIGLGMYFMLISV